MLRADAAFGPLISAITPPARAFKFGWNGSKHAEHVARHDSASVSGLAVGAVVGLAVGAAVGGGVGRGAFVQCL